MDNEILLTIEDTVSERLKQAFSLNDSEMKRRRFLLGKDTLSIKEERELQILNLRVFLHTKEDILKAIESLKQK